MWRVVCLIVVVICLGLFYFIMAAKRKMNQIVLMAEDGDKPKHLPSFGNPITTFSNMIYDATILKKSNHERSLAWADRFGTIKTGTSYLFGKVFILTWNPTFVTEVFVRPDVEAWGKLRGFSALFDKITGESVVSVDGEQWKKQRKIMKPSFKYTNLKHLLPKFQTIAEVLCVELDKACVKGEFQPHYWMSKATLDALGKGGFGMDFGALSGQMTEIYSAYDKLVHAMFNPLRLIDWYSKLPLKENKEIDQAVETFWKWTLLTVQERLKAMEESDSEMSDGNLLDMMIEAHFAENSELNQVELLNNVFLFFLAGHETTSGTLTFVLDALARNQDVQEKCREEISSLFAPGEQPTYEKIKKLQYLNQVISETMRIKPLVNAITREAKKDTTVMGYFIPKGTIVSGFISNLQYDPQTWKDPETFDPTRWSETKSNHSTPYFMPFGAGPRICLGMNFANLEMRTILINLLLRYKFDVQMDLTFGRSITLIPKAGYSLKISRLDN